MNTSKIKWPYRPGFGVMVSLGNWAGFTIEPVWRAGLIRVVAGFMSVTVTASDLDYSLACFIDGWTKFLDYARLFHKKGKRTKPQDVMQKTGLSPHSPGVGFQLHIGANRPCFEFMQGALGGMHIGFGVGSLWLAWHNMDYARAKFIQGWARWKDTPRRKIP
jgi:hypothetical protein